MPIAFKPAAILAGEIALSHRTRPGGAHHAPSRRRSQASRPSPCPVRHRRLAVSGPLASELASQPPSAGLPIPRGYSRVPPKIRIVPVNAVGSARSATPACAWTAIEATRGQSSGCCSQPTAAAGRRTTGRDRGSSGGMRTGAPAHRRSVATWHPPPYHGGAHTVPGSVDAVPSATVVYQASSGQATRNTLAGTSLPLRTPFTHAVRLIQKNHPAILAVTGSDHSPVALISGMGGFVHRNTQSWSSDGCHAILQW